MSVSWKFTLAVVLQFSLAMDVVIAQPAISVTGVYQMDCKPIGPIVSGWPQRCEAMRADGTLPTYRFSVDDKGRWEVVPPLSGAVSGRQALESMRFEGHSCVQAPLVMVCEVPREADIFTNMNSPGPSVQSRSGLIVMVANFGVADLIKVAEK